MRVTEVEISTIRRDDPGSNDRVLAYASIVLDGVFVVRDLRIIDGGKGAFVAMPCRKLTDRCEGCRAKNQVRARFCGQCGRRLPEGDRARRDAEGRAKLYSDIAFPIIPECRAMIEEAVLDAYHAELGLAQEPAETRGPLSSRMSHVA